MTMFAYVNKIILSSSTLVSLSPSPPSSPELPYISEIFKKIMVYF